LFGELAAGRPHALGEIYDAHAPALMRHASVLTRRRADAEDLVHTVFVKLPSMGVKLLGVQRPAGYLHRMLHTAWLDAYRRSVTDERAMEQVTTAASWVPAHGQAIDVARALDGLPAGQREVVVLHVVEGFSFREIGRLTDVSMFTAAARYRLAIGRMRRALRLPEGTT